MNIYQVVCERRELKKENERGDEEIEAEKMKKILEQLNCSVCLDVLDQPMVIKKCLHKFCRDCMQRQLNTKPDD